jgi:hypothetical protein
MNRTRFCTGFNRAAEANELGAGGRMHQAAARLMRIGPRPCAKVKAGWMALSREFLRPCRRAAGEPSSVSCVRRSEP